MATSLFGAIDYPTNERASAITVDYGVPYLWTVTAVKGVSKWGPDLWDACISTYFYSQKDKNIQSAANTVSDPSLTLTKDNLDPVIATIAKSNGKNYFKQIETACKKPLFLHPAVDYGTTGEIKAVAQGTIKSISTTTKTKTGFAGKAVYIEHDLICTTDKVKRNIKFYGAYYHLDKLAQGLAVGKNVETGQVIAGTTYTWPDTASGNRHLHFEVHSKAGLFDRWVPSDAIQVNMFSYVDNARYQLGLSSIYGSNITFKEFKEKVSNYLQQNPPTSLEKFKGDWIKKTAEGSIKEYNINSDMFLQTLDIFILQKNRGEILRALRNIPRYSNVYGENNKKNYSIENEKPSMPDGYVDPKEIFDINFTNKLLPPKK